MSQSKFLIIVGTGNHYTGIGIRPDWLFTFYDNKAMWMMHKLGTYKRYRLRTDDCYKIDDAFLMISLLILESVLPKENFNKNFILSHFKIKNECIFVKDKKLANLYDENKKFISNINIKLVFIYLQKRGISFGYSASIPSKNELIKKIKEYGIKNFEICD